MFIRSLFLGVPIEKSGVDQCLPSNAPSLFDYDIVVSDVDKALGGWEDRLPVEGPQSGFSRRDYGPIRTLNSKLLEEARLLLQKGGLLVCLLKPVRGFSYEYTYDRRRHTNHVTNYGWIPIKELSEHAHWHIAYGRGKRIHLSDEPSAFDQYLRMPETYWIAYFKDVEQLKIECCLATNDAGMPIALEVPIKKGWLVFLPVSHHPKSSEILLQCATRFLVQKRVHGRPSPEWLKNFKVPNENKMDNDLQDISHHILRWQARFQKLSVKKDKKTEIKKLLYEGNEALETTVRNAFEEIGFVLTRKDDMDWISSSDVGEAILEVTGSEGSIDIDKLRQLLNYLLNDYKTTGTEKKAILVANHFINDPPDRRENAFTEKVLNEAGVHTMCLLTTTELFNAICTIRRKGLEPEAVRKKIMQAIGICKLT